MSTSNPTPDQPPEKLKPTFVPNQTRRTFFQSKFYYRLKYILRRPTSTTLGAFITGALFIAGSVNLGTYLWFGSGHPLNRYQWEKMKERGELPPELLEKERILKLYSLDKYYNPRDPLPQQKTMQF
ncbi:hypothetical protein FO519_007183 [Halicephalobus sp. NKZ332]|nr:hypothetical protein FO519_007183 [Halicephalobus sp. NKZ332]